MQTNHLTDVKEAADLSDPALQEPDSHHARHYLFPGNCTMELYTRCYERYTGRLT